MLAILPLFFVGLTVHNEAAAQLTIEEPYVEISSILVKNKSWYDVQIKIHAGDKDLPAGKLLVTSDTSREEINHDKVQANQFTSERAIIHADIRFRTTELESSFLKPLGAIVFSPCIKKIWRPFFAFDIHSLKN